MTSPVFITAAPEKQAFQRFRKLQMRGFPDLYEGVLVEIVERDARVTSRSASPMKAAPDAHILDTTHLAASAVLELALVRVAEKLRRMALP